MAMGIRVTSGLALVQYLAIITMLRVAVVKDLVSKVKYTVLFHMVWDLVEQHKNLEFLVMEILQRVMEEPPEEVLFLSLKVF
jgi:hypothetical protein